MNTTILVWILMSSARPYSGSSTKTVQYSPPVAELVDCQRMQTAIDTDGARCVQVRMVIGVQK